jgi:hypothetical protein
MTFGFEDVRETHPSTNAMLPIIPLSYEIARRRRRYADHDYDATPMTGTAGGGGAPGPGAGRTTELRKCLGSFSLLFRRTTSGGTRVSNPRM